MPGMTKPPGKLLPLVAALLCGAVLAQAAKPSDQSVTSAAPAVRTVAHDPLNVPVEAQPTHRPSQPGQRKHQSRQQQRTTGPADDWNLTGHGKVLYLTFDDGPQPDWTPKVLQVLRKHRAKATFFVLGIQVAQ